MHDLDLHLFCTESTINHEVLLIFDQPVKLLVFLWCNMDYMASDIMK